jgi:hypothetical protein
MKTKLLLFALCVSGLSYAQVQPTVHNATFDNIAKSSGGPCACAGWINKDIADQGETSTVDGEPVAKVDDLESDGYYQEVAVVANSDYTLDLQYKYNSDPTTTTHLEVTVLKGSGYKVDYTPAYDPPATAAQDGFGYDTVAAVELAANQLAQTLIVPPGDTNFNAMTQMTFNTGSETSIAIFIRAVGPYDLVGPPPHGDPSKEKGWMNGDSEVRFDNLVLVNTTTLSVDSFLANSFKVYPNPANDFITIQSKDIKVSSVDMYNVLGAKVLSSELTNNQVNVSSLVKGVYFMKIHTEGGSATKKVVIE